MLPHAVRPWASRGEVIQVLHSRTSVLLLTCLGFALASLWAPRPVRAEGPDPVLETAETFSVPSFAVGLLAAFNITDMTGTTELNVAGTQLAPELVGGESGSIGAFVALRLRPRIALRVEAMLEQRGAAALGSVPIPDTRGAPYSFDYAFLYLTIPVVAEWHIPYDGSISPLVFGGIKLAVNLDADVAGEALVADMDGNPVVVDDTEDISEAARFDVGGVVGIGVRFPLSRGALRLDVRVSQGVTKVLDGYEVRPQQGLSLTGRKLRTRALSVVVSYEL